MPVQQAIWIFFTIIYLDSQMGRRKKDAPKVRRGGRDKNGGGHLAESAKPKAWSHPFLSLTGPPIQYSGVFFLFGEVEIENCRCKVSPSCGKAEFILL
jgi:hypothetical protein